MDLSKVQSLTTYEECSGYLNAELAKEMPRAVSLFEKAREGSNTIEAYSKFGKVRYETSYYDKSGNFLFTKVTQDNGYTTLYIDATDGNFLQFTDRDCDGNFEMVKKTTGYGEDYWTIRDRDDNGDFDLGYVAEGRRFALDFLKFNLKL